ncbi:CARDB domain-containing protein [Sorangium sp. So ce854]|uniref:CARDB domain-containing protein n=1 Tax=Sorangium sp. So ce854 TaxID=3133322 RepID=UPI003F62221A
MLIALCGGLLCSCSEPQATLFPGPLEPVAEADCRDEPAPLGVVEGWSMAAGWESRVVCEHGHSHRHVDGSLPGQLCLGLNGGVGAMVAHPPVADGPGTYAVRFAAQVKSDQRIEVVLSRGTDSESPDWARSVSAALECSRPCESAADGRPRRCRPVVRFHNTPELGLDADPPHGRHEARPGHSAQDYELQCALKGEHGFPLPTSGAVSAEIVVERRSLGWKIDGALVSGFGPSYRLDRARWSCEHMDGTPAESAAQRLFVVGMPFAEPAGSPDQPGYELAIEHWSPDGARCAAAPLAGEVSGGAWMCVRDARYAPCDEGGCPETCGDGTCDAWEACSTCQSDCGACGRRVAELVVASIACGQSVEAGGPVSCELVLANQGAADAGEFDNQLWLSPDEAFSGVDALLGSCRSSPIAAGSTSTVTCGGAVPPATEAGTWYLGFIADSSDAVVELDELNNLGHASIAVASDYVPPADLAFSSVDCLSLPLVTGREVECLVTVASIGGQSADPFLVALRLSSDTIITGSDTLLGTCQGHSMAPGTSRTFVCTGAVPLGTMVGPWFMGVMVDSDDAVPESDESNNTGHHSGSVFVQRGPPDLVVSSVDCPSSAMSPGAITCSARISNQGDSAVISFSSEMRLSSDTNITRADALLGACGDVFGLPAGGSQTITCRGDIPAGHAFSSQYVGILADSSSSVPELDESNNTGHDAISIRQSQADLVVSSVDCPPSATSPGAITCSARISNQGGSAASWFSSEMRLSSDTNITSTDALLGACDIVSLPAGGSQTITCRGEIPAGHAFPSQYVGILADSSSSVPELDERNNTGHDAISIRQSQADLVVSSVDCPSSATSPGAITCSVRISNQGSSAASWFSIDLRLSRDTNIASFDTPLGSCDIVSLPAGASQTVSCRGNIPAGHALSSQYVGVVADSSSRVSESNESNNTGYDSITLTGG